MWECGNVGNVGITPMLVNSFWERKSGSHVLAKRGTLERLRQLFDGSLVVSFPTNGVPRKPMPMCGMDTTASRS